jgi:hypothetical protein
MSGQAGNIKKRSSALPAFYRSATSESVECIVFDNLIVDLFGMALVVFGLIGLVPTQRPSRRPIGDI